MIKKKQKTQRRDSLLSYHPREYAVRELTHIQSVTALHIVESPSYKKKTNPPRHSTTLEQRKEKTTNKTRLQRLKPFSTVKKM